jgi:pyruvate dehydrogenase E2 component (dihydrolipoamide acetyltransferase)
MPALGMAQETGKLIAWLKRGGEYVTEGEAVMEIETDKTTVEIEATGSGILAGVLFQESEDIPVGQTMAWILEPGETVPVGDAIVQKVAESSDIEDKGRVPSVSPVARRMAEEHGVDQSLIKPSGRRVKKNDVLAYLNTQKNEVEGTRLFPASPKARRLARESGIELSNIPGTGPMGAVLAADVIDARETGLAKAATQSISSIWSRMAEQVTHSWTSAPHFYLLREVNASSLIAWRTHLKERTGKSVTYTDLLVKLVAAALRQHPRLNNFWDNNTMIVNQEINIGIAVAVEDGLVVPVIHKADELTIRQITDRRQELVERSQNKKLLLDDLQKGTFTISNLGMYGVDIFNAILKPPQAAILAVGRIVDRVVPVGDRPVVQPMMFLSISYDHRIVDGARGAQFLETLAQFIEEPFRLVE